MFGRSPDSAGKCEALLYPSRSSYISLAQRLCISLPSILAIHFDTTVECVPANEGSSELFCLHWLAN